MYACRMWTSGRSGWSTFPASLGAFWSGWMLHAWDRHIWLSSPTQSPAQRGYELVFHCSHCVLLSALKYALSPHLTTPLHPTNTHHPSHRYSVKGALFDPNGPLFVVPTIVHVVVVTNLNQVRERGSLDSLFICFVISFCGLLLRRRGDERMEVYVCICRDYAFVCNAYFPIRQFFHMPLTLTTTINTPLPQTNTPRNTP